MLNVSEYVGNPHELPVNEFTWMEAANNEYVSRIKGRHFMDEMQKYQNVMKKLYKTSPSSMQDKIIRCMMDEVFVGSCYDEDSIRNLFER